MNPAGQPMRFIALMALRIVGSTGARPVFSCSTPWSPSAMDALYALILDAQAHPSGLRSPSALRALVTLVVVLSALAGTLPSVILVGLLLSALLLGLLLSLLITSGCGPP